MRRESNTSGIRRTLCDAGCNPVIADKFIAFQEEGRVEDQLRLLKAHRAALLKKTHDNQKRIDCLDYLIFSMTQTTQ